VARMMCVHYSYLAVEANYSAEQYISSFGTALVRALHVTDGTFNGGRSVTDTH